MNVLGASVLGGAAVAILGTLLTWTSVDDVRVDGLEGPNNGWLVVVVALFAAGWARGVAGGSRVATVGVAGVGVVIVGTVLENWTDGRAVLDSTLGVGEVLTALGGMTLVLVGVAALVRPRAGAATS